MLTTVNIQGAAASAASSIAGLAAMIPSVEMLDMSSTLVSRWTVVVDIARVLPKLNTLRLM